MINHISAALLSLVPISIRFEVQQAKRRLVGRLKSLLFWKWQNFRFPLSETNTTVIHFKGRLVNKYSVMRLLGIDKNIAEHTKASENEVFVTEHPMRGAICIPNCLSTIVKLGRPIEDILASYSRSLRRSINDERPKYRFEKITDINQVNAIDHEMLRPYAAARHDLGAWQLDFNEIKQLAQTEAGRLDLLYQGDEKVGCHLGNFYIRNGKRYWHVHRLGYPEAVFSDFKRWGEVNSINLHLALEAAIKNGYDYCDYGISLAKPGAGLIEWKRRRKGFLSTSENFKYFYLRPPKLGVAQFFWDAPIFGVEKHKPTLHLGIPADKTDEELTQRYREMGYGGLYKVYLHCAKPPSKQFVEMIQSLYADQESQPVVVTTLVK